MLPRLWAARERDFALGVAMLFGIYCGPAMLVFSASMTGVTSRSSAARSWLDAGIGQRSKGATFCPLRARLAHQGQIVNRYHAQHRAGRQFRARSRTVYKIDD